MSDALLLDVLYDFHVELAGVGLLIDSVTPAPLRQGYDLVFELSGVSLDTVTSVHIEAAEVSILWQSATSLLCGFSAAVAPGFWNVVVANESGGSASIQIEVVAGMAAIQYPAVDTTREARLVDDICVLLHDTTTATQTKIERWLKQVLLRAQRGRVWWFLQRSRTSALPAGFDIVDLTGSIDRVRGVLWGSNQVEQTTLAQLLRLRGQCAGKLNAGEVQYYAIESGHRLHFWPAPSVEKDVQILYTAPLAIDSVPEEWEPLLMDGVLGLYGRHFDRDSLTQDPEAFEQRFLSALNECNRESLDMVSGHTPMSLRKSWESQGATIMRPETVSLFYYAVPEIDFPGAEP